MKTHRPSIQAKQWIAFFLFIILSTISSWGQIVITGTVVDETQVPAGNGSSYREDACTIADFGQVALCFAVNNGYDVDFYIKDITFEEYIEEN